MMMSTSISATLLSVLTGTCASGIAAICCSTACFCSSGICSLASSRANASPLVTGWFRPTNFRLSSLSVTRTHIGAFQNCRTHSHARRYMRISHASTASNSGVSGSELAAWSISLARPEAPVGSVMPELGELRESAASVWTNRRHWPSASARLSSMTRSSGEPFISITPSGLCASARSLPIFVTAPCRILMRLAFSRCSSLERRLLCSSCKSRSRCTAP